MSRLIDADLLCEEHGISHEACAKCAQNELCHGPYDEVPTYTTKDFCQWLDDAQTIEPKRAEWIKRDVSYFISPYEYECGDCGFQITQNERTAFNFCPSCGADMRGKINGPGN